MDISVETDGDKNNQETRCGAFGCYPKWLQFFSSKMTFVVFFGMVGMNQLAIGSYAVATITTLEKRFKIPSQTSGILTGGWDMGTIFSSLTMAYIGSKGHKTRWVAFGTVLVSLACYSQMVPYLLYGPGSDAIALANSGNTILNQTSSYSICSHEVITNEDCIDGDSSSTPPVLIFMSQFLLGVGTSMYWTLGIAYLDDNVRKNEAPWLIAISATIRLFGSPIGFWVAARSLEYYVDPTLSPPITNEDVRWIGAWWMGWIPFGIMATLFSFLLFLFPRVLPSAVHDLKKTKQSEQKKDNLQVQESQIKNKHRGFLEMLKRLFKNPLLLCNTFSYVFYMFGIMGYYVFMPKYMETQFHMTASDANLVTGVVGLLSAALGVISSGYVLTSFKPSARTLAGWNIIVESMGVLCTVYLAELGCFYTDFHGTLDADGSWNLGTTCNSQCNCDPSTAFEPVCDVNRSVTFFSPCHAGCTDVDYINQTKIFTNCSCIPGTFMAQDSICPFDCKSDLMIFLSLYCILNFFTSTSHSGLAIIQFRAVDPEDKSVSIALSEMLCSALAYIPGPIFYGYLVDKACLVWGESCGERGNCWLYFGQTLRYYLNYTAAGYLAMAVIFDVGIWYYSKNLMLYDDETEDEEGKDEDNISLEDKELTANSIKT